MFDDTRALVAFGSKYGATAEIASAIGETLRDAGLQTDVRPVQGVGSLEPYRVVVLGSAVYMGRWRPEALRLLRRPEIAEHEVWLFSSGPVGGDAGDPERRDSRFTRPAQVEALAAAVGAHEHVVFGGKVAEDAGFIRKRMARGMRPDLRDCRDWGAIHAWAETIAAAVASKV